MPIWQTSFMTSILFPRRYSWCQHGLQTAFLCTITASLELRTTPHLRGEIDALPLSFYIPFELTRPTEERILRFGHAFAVQQSAFNERRRANKIGDLKQFVILRPDITGKFNRVADICRKRLVQEVCDRRLSAVIVNLDFVKGMRLRRVGGEKRRQFNLEV